MYLIYFFHSNIIFFYFVVGIVGLVVGSFLNVVIHRIPKMMERDWKQECRRILDVKNEDEPVEKYNLILPRSACPHCNHKISALENIPVISYLILGGKCSECNNQISIRYPAVEISTSILSLIIAATFGVTIQFILAIVLTWTLIAQTMIDYDCQLLPDDITMPILWLGIIANMFGTFTDIYSSLLGAIFGYLILWIVYMVFKIVTGKEGMGYGDFKLLAMLGAWLGWQMLPLIIILSSIAGALVGLGLIFFYNHSQSKPIPFGPYLAIAGWIALIYGNELTTLYYNWAVA